MGSPRVVGTSVIAIALAACGGAKPVLPATRTVLDSGQSLDFVSLTGGVQNANAIRPPCPVVAHVEATLSFTNMSGKITYRWERNTGDSTKPSEVSIPEGARAGTATLALKPDEWFDKDAGRQQAYLDRVHVLSPIDRASQPISVSAVCY